MSSVKLGLLGANGRMGTEVQSVFAKDFSANAALAAKASQGEPIDPLLACDVVIDFSAPAAVLSLIKAAGAAGTPPALIIGSTGWKLDEKRELEEYAKKAPVLVSSNFSTGVLALIEILRTASPLLEKLGYTASIVETHHKHKKDAPSGTALSLQRAIAPAGPGNVQTHSVRAGEVIGDHEVTFRGPGDSIVIAHSANDRSIFARGAIETALWLAAKRAAGTTGMVRMDAFFKERYA